MMMWPLATAAHAISGFGPSVIVTQNTLCAVTIGRRDSSLGGSVKAALWFLLVPVVAVVSLALLITRSPEVLAAAAIVLASGAAILGVAAWGRRRLLRRYPAETREPLADGHDGSSARTTVVLLAFCGIVTALTFGGSRLGASTLAVEGTYYVALILFGAGLGGWARTPPIAVSATLVMIPLVLGVVQLTLLYEQPHSPEGVLYAGGQIAFRMGLLLVDGAIGLGAWMLASGMVTTGIDRRLRRGTRTVVLPALVVLVLATPYLLDRMTRTQPVLTSDTRRPAPGAVVALTNRRTIAVPGDSSAFARSGSPLLVFLPGTRRGEDGESGVALVRGDHLERLDGHWTISLTGVDLRSTLDSDDPIVVVSGGPAVPGSEQARAISFTRLIAGASESEAMNLPTGLAAPAVVRARGGLLAAGLMTADTGLVGAMVRQLRDKGLKDLDIYELRGPAPGRIATIKGFTDDGVDLAAAVTPDGVVHLLATEARTSERARSSVRYLQFDPATRTWSPEQTLWARDDFTSSLEPRFVTTEGTLDAFWLADAGSDTLPTDGLYATRIGEAVAWRLTTTRGEYAVLPNADGHGALLVGVAMAPSEDGRIRWFIRRGKSWASAGETDLGTTLYTLTSEGTEPFALWRDPSTGSISAAFSARAGLLVCDVVLGESR
jgi:hypothetical protein